MQTETSVPPAAGTIVLIAACAFLAYVPFLWLPLISDDYLQIELARRYGAPSGWSDLSQDVLYRSRATSLLATYFVDWLFGSSAIAHNTANVLFHIINCYLVALLGMWRQIGWKVSAAAAVFFAAYEGHQEAVIWNAALPELLVFSFVLGSTLLWIGWIQTSKSVFLCGSLIAFLLALLSKESAVVLVPVLIMISFIEQRFDRGSICALTVMSLICLLYALLIFDSSTNHLHLKDGTFNWRASFLITVANSMSRLLWLWGLVAIVVRFRLQSPQARWLVGCCLFFMAITLLPYSFLSYMQRVPSRHTYLPSAALAVLAGSAFISLEKIAPKRSRWLGAVVACVFLLHNFGYLWLKKLPQYRRRAAPTESLIEFAGREGKNLELQCFPYDISIARSAVAVALKTASPHVFAKGEPAQLNTPAVPYCDSDQP